MINEDKKTCTCEICGKIFPYKHGYRTVTCSIECDTKRKKKLYTKRNKKICKNCNKEYEEKPCFNSEFCSMKCYWEYRNSHKNEYYHINDNRKNLSHETRKCEMCGKEFYTYKKTKKRFCSDECRALYAKSNECKEKRKNTLLKKYGSYCAIPKSFDKIKDKYKKERENKYNILCEKSNLEIIDYVSNHVLHVKCKTCGKDFITNNLSYLPYEIINCKHCSSTYKICKPMLKISKLLDEYNIEYNINNRHIISPYELDIVLEKQKIAIEINGNFWHSENCGKDKNYHLNKTILSNNQGYRLIHIFEDEIENKFDIVKSRILSILHIYEQKIFARKCKIQLINNELKEKFIKENSLLNDKTTKYNFALSYNNEIVSIMSFSKLKNNNFYLTHFCNKINTLVLGGFSKLLNYFIKNYNPKNIKTSDDLRWCDYNTNTQNHYTINNFKFIKFDKPNYWYLEKLNVLNRINEKDFNKIKNNIELYDNKIWDCGKSIYELKIKE